MTHFGEFIALLTAVCWTVSALAHSYASERIGSLNVNLLRLLLAMLFFSLLSLIRTGYPVPFFIPPSSWFWLSVSGLVGFVFGDLCLLKAYTVLGARISMLIMTLAPAVAAITGLLVLDESLSFLSISGMLITLLGISIVILNRTDEIKGEVRSFKMRFGGYSKKGILLAFGGAVGQGIGIVLSKLGMQNSDPFASTQIRVIAGIGGFLAITLLSRKGKFFINSLKDVAACKSVIIGSFFGPFLGVSLSLLSIKNTATGIASTLMAIVPILIIPPAIWLFKEKINKHDLFGAVVAVTGIALFFI